MKYVDEFRDPEAARAVLGHIEQTVADRGDARKPSPCYGNLWRAYHAIFRYGLDKLTPAGLEFIHGPGCRFASCQLPVWMNAWKLQKCQRLFLRPLAMPCVCQGPKNPCYRRVRKGPIFGLSIPPLMRWNWPGGTLKRGGLLCAGFRDDHPVFCPINPTSGERRARKFLSLLQPYYRTSSPEGFIG